MPNKKTKVKHRKEAGERLLGSLIFPVDPTKQAALEMYCKKNNGTTKSGLLRVKLDQLLNELGIQPATPEETAAHFGAAWCKKHGYSANGGGE